MARGSWAGWLGTRLGGWLWASYLSMSGAPTCWRSGCMSASASKMKGCSRANPASDKYQMHLKTFYFTEIQSNYIASFKFKSLI
ncbi:hypothetical protein BDY19DRAFT_328742 [Irpex rosettiformis]|uniref:Uncharacterized protein n=1 Tax=Irpex rosettiformis TaxID=378272 RepID=A0ACB8TY29_9APHY|nr:hypothetical protein BDY19DRAFT_328742 [Irpex rosettiformis]